MINDKEPSKHNWISFQWQFLSWKIPSRLTTIEETFRLMRFYEKSVYLTQLVMKWAQQRNSLCRNPAMRCYSMTMDDVVVLWNKDHWKTQDSILFEKFSSFCRPVVKAPYQRWVVLESQTFENSWYLYFIIRWRHFCTALPKNTEQKPEQNFDCFVEKE